MTTEYPYKHHDGGQYRSRRCVSGECTCAKKNLACGIAPPPPAPEQAPAAQPPLDKITVAQTQIRMIAQAVRPPGMSPEDMDRVVDRMQRGDT